MKRSNNTYLQLVNQVKDSQVQTAIVWLVEEIEAQDSKLRSLQQRVDELESRK